MFYHLVFEDLLTIKDFDGNALPSFDVLGELDLRKGTLPESLTQLVLSDPGPHPRRLDTHPVRSRSQGSRFPNWVLAPAAQDEIFPYWVGVSLPFRQLGGEKRRERRRS